jgi:hypothetical protein
MAARALTQELGRWTAPPEDAAGVVTAGNSGQRLAAHGDHPDCLSHSDGTTIVATVWLAAYLLMAISYYVSAFD